MGAGLTYARRGGRTLTREEDCSEFVKEIVLQQLWGGRNSRPIVDARSTPLEFLTSFNEEVEIVTDAPNYEWELILRLGL